MENPSSTVNTFISAMRNTYLLSSISVASFTAGYKNKHLRVAVYCAIGIMMLSIWNSLVSYKMFKRYVARAEASDEIMAHPATDVLSWNQYLLQIRVFMIIAVIAVVAMAMYIMAT
jgi:hypothetical protein